MKNTRKIVISVIGSHKKDKKVEEVAYNLGKFIAKIEAVLLCGGLGGVMESVSRGAKEAGGITIGLLPGREKSEANSYITIPLPTSIGYARNALVACGGDIIVALPGSYGTTSEICYALVFGRPVIDLGGWDIEGMIKVSSLEDAQEKIKEIIGKLREGK